MRPERWSEVKAVLSEALEAQGEARAQVLSRAEARDPQLRREVEELLAGERAAEPLTAAVASAVLDEALLGDLEGRMVGPYRLDAAVGRGGMGAVYRAHRADGQYEARVAVKLARPDLSGAEVAARFRQERQLLAPLDHPCIARLLDGGVAPDGRLYLVMEYVEGQPSDAHCREKGLGLEERLGLMRRVCSAVEHAHQRLVVHRDLKPSNVLVRADGTPKLVDFGIAKLLGPVPGGQAATQDASRFLTPGYASPEHIAGGPITTASDVFSLGVLLHELLAGCLPTPPDAAPGEKSPGGAGPLPMSAAAARRQAQGPPPPVEPRRLSGDLDLVVARALRNDPEERYRTVGELDEDLRRFLAGEPIRARPPTLTYRTGRWVARHRALSAVLLVSTALIVAGVVASLWEAHLASAAAEVAVRAEARSRKRFEDLRHLAHAVIFDYSDAIERLSGSVEVRERLVKDALNYLDGLAADAAGDAELQRELAQAYVKIGDIQGNLLASNLGHVADAAQSYRRAASLYEAAYREAPGDVARRLELGEVLAGPMADSALSRNDLGEVLSALDRAARLADQTARERPQDPRLLALQAHIEQMWIDASLVQADAADAGHHAERFCAVSEAAANARSSPLDAEVAVAYCESTRLSVLAPLGLHGQAVAHGREAVARVGRVARARPDDAYRKVDLAVFRARLARELADGDRPAEAVALSRDAESSMAEVLAQNRQNAAVRYRMAQVLMIRALALLAAGQASSALEPSARAVDLERELDGSAGGNVTFVVALGMAREIAGEVLEEQGARAGALEAFREAEGTFDRLLGAPEHRQARWLRARVRARAAALAGPEGEAELEEAVTAMEALSDADAQSAAKRRDLARWYARLSERAHEPPPAPDGCTRSPWLARAGRTLRDLEARGAWLGDDDRLVPRGPCR